MTNELHVSLRSRTCRENGFLPRYDDDAGVIEVTSDSAREWQYGINVGAAVVFDLDADRVMLNFDVLIPKKRWKLRLDPGKPEYAREADLQFDQDTLRAKSFSLPVIVSSDSARRHVLIAFGELAPDATPTALSDRCFAFIERGVLLGFYLDFGQESG